MTRWAPFPGVRSASSATRIETSEDECPMRVTLRQSRSRDARCISAPSAFDQRRKHDVFPTQIRGKERGCLLRVIAGHD